MSAISAVLPLKAYGRRYIDDPGRCHILLTSLATFAPDDMFEDIFVVVPTRERAHAEALRRDWQSLPLVVIDEEEILPAIRDHPLTLNAGWYRQQLVKLCAANLSKTEFFITFDSDVILTKPIRESAARARGPGHSFTLVDRVRSYFRCTRRFVCPRHGSHSCYSFVYHLPSIIPTLGRSLSASLAGSTFAEIPGQFVAEASAR